MNELANAVFLLFTLAVVCYTKYLLHIKQD